MKILYSPLMIILSLIIPFIGYNQEVTTFATLTANGGVSVDKDGNLFVAHFGPLPPNSSIGRHIFKITPQGAVSVFVDGELKVGSGNAIDGDGFLYQSNFNSGAIYKIATGGNIVDNSYATIAGPVGIAAASDNSLYICSCNENVVKKVSPTGDVTTFASGSTFSCANGITIGDNGNIYTTNFSNGDITKITPNGTATLLGSTPVGNGHIVYRPKDQHLYIASYTGHNIYKMNLSGTATLFAGTGIPGKLDATNPLEATFNKPNGIAISNDQCKLYITQDENVIRAIHFQDAECITSVEELINVPGLSIYPNPATDFLQFENSSKLEFTTIQFVDSYGRIVKQHQLTNSTAHRFDISVFPVGSYSVLLKTKSGRVFSYNLLKQI